MADPGFPRGGGANSPGGTPTYDFVKFSRKLNEIERIWTPGGRGTASKILLCRSATDILLCRKIFFVMYEVDSQCCGLLLSLGKICTFSVNEFAKHSFIWKWNKHGWRIGVGTNSDQLYTGYCLLRAKDAQALKGNCSLLTRSSL